MMKFLTISLLISTLTILNSCNASQNQGEDSSAVPAER